MKTGKASESVKKRAAEAMGSERGVMLFRGRDIPGMAEILEAAADVRAIGKSAAVKDWKLFRLLCGLNRTTLLEANKALTRRVGRIITEGNTNGWIALAGCLDRVACTELIDASRENKYGAQPPGGHLVDPDYVLGAVMDVAGPEAAAISDGFGAERADVFLAKANELCRSVRFRAAFEDRWVVILEAIAEMDKRIPVEVMRVSWRRAPEALHGGYLAAMAWMWTELPQAVQEAVGQAAAKPPKMDEGEHWGGRDGS